MTSVWITIVAVAFARAAIKAVGPVMVGGRDLPPRVVAVVALLAPALLAALVVTETFGEERHLVLDERAAGVAVAGVALTLRASVLVAVALGAVATALIRVFV